MLFFRKLLIGLLIYGWCSSAVADEPLFRLGQPTVAAELAGITAEGAFEFQIAGQRQQVSASELVRWSFASVNAWRSELVLIDGSRLVLADAWSGRTYELNDDKTISVQTQLLGEMQFEQSRVSSIVLHAPQATTERQRFFDRLAGERGIEDGLLMVNGDRLAGRVADVTEIGKGQWQVHLQTQGYPKTAASLQPLLVRENKVAAITWRRQSDLARPQAKLLVGLRDGSQLQATSMVGGNKQCLVRLACGVDLRLANTRNINHLCSLASKFLSNLPVADYQHVPYLEIPWPYRYDRNVLGGPLQTQGQSYAKGLGLHTASRLTYDLESLQEPNLSRLVADVAIDDAAGRRGSVIFRVYLEVDGQWQEAFASSVVRGGDPPVPVAVELGDATRMALVTDFADRGDECDYANWLDARLE